MSEKCQKVLGKKLRLLQQERVKVGSSMYYLFPPLQFLEEWPLLLLLLHSPLLQGGEKMVSTFPSTQHRVKSGFHSENKKNSHLFIVKEKELGKQLHQLLLVCCFLSTASPRAPSPQKYQRKQRKLVRIFQRKYRESLKESAEEGVYVLSIHKIISNLLLYNMKI